ncbi:hypothetical protein Tco_0962053 [Tanacetum coccineum]
MLRPRQQTSEEEKGTVDGMDENMIRLLLKDQATRGLLQTLYGGSGGLGSTLPRSMRLDVPKFNGADPEKHQERLNKELCFNCDNKWVRGHKWSGKFLLVMADEDDDTVQESKQDTLDATESGDIYILNSSIGQEWMPDSQLANSPYHLEGKVNFEGVGNVTPWAADVVRRKRVKCYVQGSGRRKRKTGVGRGSRSPDSTRISC